MGRKPIMNVEKKIMQEVLREDFKQGISNLSTREIASHLHISEPVIFSHFQTKQNLFDRTFEYAWQFADMSRLLPPVSDQAFAGGYLPVYQTMIAEPECLLFVQNYIHSSYFHLQFVSQVEHSGMEESVAYLCEHNGKSEKENRSLCVAVMSSLLSKLAQMAVGAVSQSEEELRILFHGFFYGLYGKEETA
jgi:AcrR family transcriptional regulator